VIFVYGVYGGRTIFLFYNSRRGDDTEFQPLSATFLISPYTPYTNCAIGW